MMRFKITIETGESSQLNIIPIDYQYPLASVIYKIIEKGDSTFSEWLHETGIEDGNKKFKLFTFSRLKPHKYRIENDRLILQSSLAEFIISFCIDGYAEPFIKGLFTGACFELGDNVSRAKFNVIRIEKLPDITFGGKKSFRCLSPVVISFRPEGRKYPEYLKPDSEQYRELIIKNLVQKYNAFSGKTKIAITGELLENYMFKITGDFRKKGVTIKHGKPDESKIIGYEYQFDLNLPGPLMQIGYYAGFGEKNSMGFGCVEVIGV